MNYTYYALAHQFEHWIAPQKSQGHLHFLFEHFLEQNLQESMCSE